MTTLFYQTDFNQTIKAENTAQAITLTIFANLGTENDNSNVINSQQEPAVITLNKHGRYMFYPDTSTTDITNTQKISLLHGGKYKITGDIKAQQGNGWKITAKRPFDLTVDSIKEVYEFFAAQVEFDCQS